jgi:mono/diheme cytochrome c family protein
VLRWAGIGAVVIMLLALAGAFGVYVASERVLRRTYDVPLIAVALPTDPADIAEGERLARLRGCFGGCHGRTLEGELFVDDPMIARLAAPNLTAILRDYSDAELERVIRRGVRNNGRSVFVMPSSMFSHLSDDDLGRIIAFLRSASPVDGTPSTFSVGPLGRLGLATGQFPPLADEIAGAQVRQLPAGSGQSGLELGEYIALTVCTECHGRDLRGAPDGGTTDLAMAGAYSDHEFVLLMSTGIGLGGRDLGLMTAVARSRFSYLTAAEVGALHGYLKTLAASRADAS